ncbi:DUF4395 family protein [Nonomuraea gerenzanensis]|uniref:DUF4395 family protein n=1 Tax=Nonomuraea gerenzanensis TaxID=93944 RepID=UPI001CDA1876|nr:DUF4395 family protein [Nonomuraea gerenzanensis]UBU14172.1 DUF4395 family protein [Nonomuraea gerenzanensis]
MRADPRALRFGAAVTTLVPVSVLLTGSLPAVRRPGGGARARSASALVVGDALRGARPERSTTDPTAAALLAAFLNAAIGFCLGCATYPLIRRLLPAANMEVSQ